ncbi:tetratricopeptide repeat-containing sensor histidine kinase [Confluentibacter sediminis]|uniref:tetratricopeptide repeat-containing sensor histidine kinase n=1 Tax=Confluentibacter sediminis TaxID=2219045 RepID=UPI000DAD0977|nr:ATP-binding protein [Confluentibacter sediminis]
MRKYLILILTCITYFSFGQQEPILSTYNTQKEKLQAWDDYCGEVATNTEEYQHLIKISNEGIALAGYNGLYLAKFYFYKGYGYEYNNNLYKDAIINYEKSLFYAKKSKNLKSETDALMRLNYLYYSVKEFKKRDTLINVIKKIIDTTKNTYTLGVLNGSLGEYYLDNSDYEKFIHFKLRAIEFRKKFPKRDISNSDNIGISYEQIASSYIKMKQFDKAIEYTNYAKPYINNSKSGLAYLYDFYIQCYSNLHQQDSIKKYYTEIYNLVSRNDSLHLNISYANRLMAEYYLNNKQLSAAFSYAEKAISNAKKSNDEEILMEANMVYGRLLYQKKDYKNAINTLMLASGFALDFDKEHYIKINKLLSKSYAAIGEWQNAYKYNTIYSDSNEEILQESAKQSIANAEAKYQNKVKKQEIQNKNTQIKTANKQKFYFIIGIFLLIIIGSLLFYQSRSRKKINEKLQLLNQELNEANKVKTRFFSVLNHDLRGPVANLIFFLQLQKESPELLDEESTKRMQDKTMTGAENLLNAMEDILQWSKSQMENFKPQPREIAINSLFEDTKAHFSSEKKVHISFENTQNVQINTDENYLKTIIRNLTGNAIKALDKIENPTIIWKAWQENNQSFLSISDNGKGASDEKFKALYDDKEVVGIKTGLGLHLIRDLAKAIDCKITVNSKVKEGTTFILKMRNF